MIRKVKGTRDILPPETRLWNEVVLEPSKGTKIFEIFFFNTFYDYF